VQVDRLELEDFRNYERQSAAFAPGINLIVGRNAQGKTNLLEAVYLLGGLGSPRSADADLVRQGCDRAVVHAEVARGSRRVRVDIELRPGRGARALLNGSPISGTRALKELVTTVFFGPDELSLIKGSPDGRRRFVDEVAMKLRPARDAVRREWERVLRQRNALLKSAPLRGSAGTSARATLEVWDEAFARVGAELAAARFHVLGRLAPYAAKRYVGIAGGGDLHLRYASGWLEADVSDAWIAEPDTVDVELARTTLERRIDEVREREIERGMSLVGPQRDDVDILLTSASGTPTPMDARLFASQGDQRTCALALKLGEHDLVTDALGEQPILLLDDVFSELDPARRSWLADAVRSIGQTFISSAEPGAIEAVGEGRVIEVDGGVLRVG
jgi:DNA replication and repair protein RecF